MDLEQGTITMSNALQYSWAKYAQKHLLGKKIVNVNYLVVEDVHALGWQSSAVIIELDDGTILYPSTDDEGNDAGALFGQTADGEDLVFPVCS